MSARRCREGIRGRAILALVVKCIVRVAKVKVVGDAAQRFGMSEEQKSTGRERRAQTRDRRAHLLRREIHQNVAAEDHVVGRRLPQRRVVTRQVCLFELDGAAHTVVQYQFATLGCGTTCP